jgi:hypothetical protein
VLYDCPRTNLDKLTRVEVTPPHLPLRFYDCPSEPLDNLTRPDIPTGLVMLFGTLLLFGGYALGALALRRSTTDDRRPTTEVKQRTKNKETTSTNYGLNTQHAIRNTQYVSDRLRERLMMLALLGFPLLFLALLLRVYPATSVDLYDYLFRGRMLARYGANTFVHVPQDFAADPLFDYAAWRQAVTAYGPLWEGLSWLTARLAGERPDAPVMSAPFVSPSLGTVYSGYTPGAVIELLRLMLAFKGLAALGFLLCGVAIWGALGRIAPEQRRLGLYLWLWNPLALWESVGVGHNDAWMALLIVLAVWAFSKPRTENREPRIDESPLSVVSGQLQRTTDYGPRTADNRSIFTSSITAFLALTAGGLIKFLSLVLGPIFLAAALRRLPDWRARARLALVVGLACLVFAALAYAPFWAGWATFRNFSDRVALFTATWLAALRAGLTEQGVPQELAQQIATTIGLWLLLGGACWAAWRAWRAPERVAAHALWLLLWFLFACNTWFQPWYLFWPLALAALQPWRGRMLLVVGLLCCSAMLGCYVAWSFLRPQLGWDVASARWNALLCALIYAPPLLALGASTRAWGLLTRRAGRLAAQSGQLSET